MHNDNPMHDGALLLARAVAGASIAAHGAQKLFGWFGGSGPEATAKMFKSLGFQPPETMARLAALTEVSSGALMIAGAGGPLGPMMLTGVMTVGGMAVHAENGFFAQDRGVELNVTYVTIAVLLAMQGYGRFSLDEALGIRKTISQPLLGWIALAGGVGAALAILARREPPQAPATEAPSKTEMVTLGAPAQNITPATQ